MQPRTHTFEKFGTASEVPEVTEDYLGLEKSRSRSSGGILAATILSLTTTCNTRDSTVVPLRSTNRARWSLPSKFEMGLGACSYAVAACVHR
jgi:hypothetical protein